MALLGCTEKTRQVSGLQLPVVTGFNVETLGKVFLIIKIAVFSINQCFKSSKYSVRAFPVAVVLKLAMVCLL